MDKSTQKILIFGASSGFGLATAKFLIKQNCLIIGTSRKNFSCSDPFGFEMLNCDITNPHTVAWAIKEAECKLGGLSAIINCAGHGLSGASETATREQAQGEFDVNYFGAVNVLNCALRLTASRKDSPLKLIQISSIAAVVGVPFQPYYSASKAAIEMHFESVDRELLGQALQLVLIEPGDFATHFTVNRKKTAQLEPTAGDEKSIYNALRNLTCKKAVGEMECSEQNGRDPQDLAKLISRILKMEKPKLRYHIGKPMEILALYIKPLLPQNLFRSLIQDNYKIK